ncbi:MAG TPA: phospholipase D-like domain-containing protein [Tepidisphaeraceae bacterium]|nr:phospholipase D-like domain-containing protein [Tepidisphaeraceae bacterium]
MDDVAASHPEAVIDRGATLPAQHPAGRAQAGMAPGINIRAGSRDDGWTVPSPVVLSDGTALQLYKDGEALHAVYEAIEGARERICLEVYIFRSDPTGQAFAELLAKKALQGVQVFVIYDSFGSLETDPAMFEQMARAGVRLGVFHPMKPWECRYGWRPANRDHRKLVIIDDDMAGLGGLNIGGEYAGSWVVPSKQMRTPWRDNAVGIRGPSARLLLIPFARTWRYVEHGGKLSSLALFHHVQEGEFGVLASVPTRHSPLTPLRRMFGEARRSILMTMSYFAPPDDLIDELCRAAHRGVQVRLMLPGEIDVHILLTAARAFYEKLLSAGIEIYERQGAVLHAKTMCIDGHTTVLGSTNLDYRSIEYNCELSVIIRSDRFGAQMHDLFNNDIRYAKRISLAEWRRRPTYDRLVQWAVMRARYLL